MQDTSNIQNWNALWGKDETRVEVRATVAGTAYDGYDGVSGVWEIKKTAPLLKTAEIGRCAAARLDLALIPPEGASIPRMAQIDVGVRLNDGTTQSGWLPKGTFFIDTRTQEDDVLKITAYDAMLKTEQSFTQAGDQGEWPRTDISVVNEIAQRIGVSVDARTTAMLNKGYLVQYPGIVLEDGTPQYSADGALSMREVLGYIGVMYGGSWVISDAGALRLVALDPSLRLQYAICFSAEDSFTIEIEWNPYGVYKNWDGTIEWTDGVNDWAVWDGTSALSSGADHKIYVRGIGNTRMTVRNVSFVQGQWKFRAPDASTTIRCKGNIEMLLDYKTAAAGNHPVMAEGCFYNLFSDASKLVEGPDLCAETLTAQCYRGMFANSGLITAPKIAATTLAQYCCYGMFENCRYLERITIPAAKTMVDYCYANMYAYSWVYCFESESVSYPVYPFSIPPTADGTGATNALSNMFATGQESVQTPSVNTTYFCSVPVDPPQVIHHAICFSAEAPFTLATANQAKNWDGTIEYTDGHSPWSVWDGTTTLSSGSDNKLYLRGTGNSVISPEAIADQLPASNFVLTGSNISCSGNIETLLDYATVASGGHPQMGERCFFGLFYQNTALVSPPELPAQELVSACYSLMYWGCTSLECVTDLPANELVNACCWGMYMDCTSVKISETQDSVYRYPVRIAKKGPDLLDSTAVMDMFDNTGGTFTGTPEFETTYYTDHKPVS